MYFFDKDFCRAFYKVRECEFYMPNGLGGYLSGTICNNSFRKQDAYLIHSFNPPVERQVLLSKVVEGVYINDKYHTLDAQEYKDFTSHGNSYLESFSFDYIPEATYNALGVEIIKRMAPLYNSSAIGIEYELTNSRDEEVRVLFTPLFSNKVLGECDTLESLKEIHTKSNKNSFITNNGRVKCYFKWSSGELIRRKNKHVGEMLARFDYETGDERYDMAYIPISIELVLKPHERRVLSLTASVENIRRDAAKIISDYKKRAISLVKRAALKDELADRLALSADSFIAYRKSTNKKTILAGLPWFADWGRDTMISFTGALLVPKRFSEAKEVLLSFKEYERAGLIPNMFPTEGEEPIYNTADASLWYFIAAYNYIKYSGDMEFVLNELYDTLYSIYYNYKNGTDFNIHMDKDGLIIAGSDLDQITWMDVRVGDVVVTPRHGKPVEINALWYNALCIMEELSSLKGKSSTEFSELKALVYESFNKRFYNSELKSLYDVCDIDDPSVRPNQLFAISLPFKVLNKDIAKIVFKTIEEELYTRYGIRSLSIKDPRFKPKYEGKLWDRDMAYHMGTAWGWLMGAYIDAYLYVNDYSSDALNNTKKIILEFNTHMHEYCINGIAEIFDGEYPAISRGCCNQAWSVCELLRAYYENLLTRGIHVNIND